METLLKRLIQPMKTQVQPLIKINKRFPLLIFVDHFNLSVNARKVLCVNRSNGPKENEQTSLSMATKSGFFPFRWRVHFRIIFIRKEISTEERIMVQLFMLTTVNRYLRYYWSAGCYCIIHKPFAPGDSLQLCNYRFYVISRNNTL